MSNQHPDAWDRLYSGEPPAWEIGHPQAAVAELAARGLFSGRMLDVGCGTGEHTILATRHGADALGIDHSPAAIRLAIEKARHRGVPARFAVADALSLSQLGETFDVILDSGLFHVFDTSERARYASSLATVLRTDGLLFITCICDRQPGDWGPHRVSERDLRGTFDRGWAIEDLSVCERETRRPEVQTSSAKAWMARIRREAMPSGRQAPAANLPDRNPKRRSAGQRAQVPA